MLINKYCAKNVELAHYHLCFATGFSGVLFALKVVNSYHSHRLSSDANNDDDDIVRLLQHCDTGLSEKEKNGRSPLKSFCIREEETQSFFGFTVPVRQAMWVELLVIQVIFVIVAFFTIIIILITIVIITIILINHHGRHVLCH